LGEGPGAQGIKNRMRPVRKQRARKVTPMSEQEVPGSFRDPSGTLFRRNGTLYRQVNNCYRSHYDRLIDSGLYEDLVASGLLVRSEEVDAGLAISDAAYKVIRPEVIPFVSYPYEWCFSQLKDAALLTLEIQRRAMGHGMTLKDSSAYNVQFLGGRAIFIDTLSFEVQEEGRPWAGYRQFCRHFLGPLALMSFKDVRLNQLARIYVDGVPLDMADKLLGLRARRSLSLYLHIHLHAKAQKRYEDKPVDLNARKVSRMALLGLVDSLTGAVRKLKWRARGTEWADYYEFTNYTDEAFEQKKTIVAEMLQTARPREAWDLGANTGVFSKLASDRGIPVIAFDVDPAAVERNYLEIRGGADSCPLPLVMDLTNPSGGLGWANEERMGLVCRGPTDTAMALALVHHLAISNNVPLARIARFFQSICKSLIIEFVPKEDSQVQRLLASRKDVFTDYNRDAFERSFGRYFSIETRRDIEGTKRTLYLMRNAS